MFSRLLIICLVSWGCTSLAKSSEDVGWSDRVTGKQVGDTVRTCVVQDGRLLPVTAALSVDGRDTLLDGQKFSSRYPLSSPPYAERMAWYVGARPIVFEGRNYAFDPREFVVTPPDLRLAGSYDGVPVFRIADGDPLGVIFVPIRPGCVFKMYQQDH